MKFKRRHKKFRQAGSHNLSDCSECIKGNHQTCEDRSMIFCRCWREDHEESF